MSEMNVVFGLPAVHQIDLFCGWLDLVDVARLDSALCCKKFRADFLALICDPHSVFAKLKIDSTSKADWVIKKNVKIGSIVLFAGIVNDAILRNPLSVLLCGPQLKDVTLCTFQDTEYDPGYEEDISTGVEPLIVALAASSPNLTRFRIKCNTEFTTINDDVLIQLLTNCKKLRVLELHSSYCGSDALFCALYSAPCLQKIVITAAQVVGNMRHKPLGLINHTVTYLDCTDTRIFYEDSDISHVCAHFPNLVTFKAPEVTNEVLVSISKHCPLLQEVIICVIEEETALLVARNWPHLRRLGLHLNTDPYASIEDEMDDLLDETCTEEAVLCFVQHCLELSYLNTVCWPRDSFMLYHPRHIVEPAECAASQLYELYVDFLSIGGLDQIQSICHRLSILAIHHKNPFELEEEMYDTEEEKPLETALHRINKNHSNIQVLYIRNYCDLSGAGIHALAGSREIHFACAASNRLQGEDLLNLASRCPDLTVFHLRNCLNMPDNFLFPFLDRCPALTHLELLVHREDFGSKYLINMNQLRELIGDKYPQLLRILVNCGL